MKGSLHESAFAGVSRVDTTCGSREGPCHRSTPKSDRQKPPPMPEARLPSCEVLYATKTAANRSPAASSSEHECIYSPAAECLPQTSACALIYTLRGYMKTYVLDSVAGSHTLERFRQPPPLKSFPDVPVAIHQKPLSNKQSMLSEEHTDSQVCMLQRTLMRPAAAQRRTCVWKVLPQTVQG